VLRERIANVRPRTVLAIAWLWLVLYGFPGQMTTDSFEHLIEARSGLYTDGSPPAYNLLFWISDQTFGGQVLVFLVQITAFVLGAYLTMRRLVPRHAHWFAFALVMFPPVFTPLALVWKDALMPALLLLAIGSFLDERRWVRLLGVAAVFGAIAIRYNAFAAAFPIVVLLFQWRDGMHWVKRTGLALVVWLATTLAAFQFNKLLTDQPMYLWHSSLALFDIAGTLKHVDGTLPDAELAPLFAGTGIRIDRDYHARIRAQYRLGNFFNLVAGDARLWDVPIRGTEPAPQAQRDAIGHAWREIVTSHPGAYLAHRLRMFREVLALQRHRHAYWAVPGREFAYPATAEREHVAVSFSRVQHVTTRALDYVWHHSSLFEPSLYLLVALLLIPLARKHRDVIALLGSGIAIELTLFFLASSPDYRYSHWMVLCTCIAIVTLVVRRSQRVVAPGRDDPALGGITREDPVDAGAPRDVA